MATPGRGRRRWRAMLLALCACGQKSPNESDDLGTTTQTGSDGTSSATVEQTTQPTTDAQGDEAAQQASCDCVIVSDTDDGHGYYDSDLCGGPPCGEIELECNLESGQEHPFCVFGGSPILDFEALDCSLDLLISGIPSLVVYRETPDDGFIYAGGLVKIGVGRLGLTHRYAGVDLGVNLSAHEVAPLRDAAYFEGCKAMADGYERYECLKDWTTGAPLVTCDEPLLR